MRIRCLISLLASLFLCACATSTQQGRAQLSVPTSVSVVYSELDMRLQLATSAIVAGACTGTECATDIAFDSRVRRLGAHLAATAFVAYPALGGNLERFEFLVADNKEPGSASSAGGTVVVFRGMQNLGLDDYALAFVIAREMGHVVDGHHDENSAAGILFSVLAQVLLPVTNLVRGASSLISNNAAAATTVASFAGSRAVRASNRPDQLREADGIALELLARSGLNGGDVAAALAANLPVAGINAWTDELRDSAFRIGQLTQGPRLERTASVDDNIAPTLVVQDAKVLVGTAAFVGL